MAWLLKHKFLTLLIICGAAYLYMNPPGRIGIARKGCVVYNRIPVLFLDCYINPDGRLFPEGDLAEKSNVAYWFDEHLSKYRYSGTGMIPLLIGNGFTDSTRLTLDREMLQKVRDNHFETHICSSPAAIDKYNKLRAEGKKAALLLKIL